MAEPGEIRVVPVSRVLPRQVGYQVRLLLRTPRALFLALLFPVLLLVVRHMAASDIPAASGFSILAGVITFGVIVTSYATHATALVEARERMVLKRLRGTPLPPWCYFAGRFAGTIVLALLGSAVTLAVAVIFLGASVSPGALPALLLAVVTGSCCWAALGTALTRVIPDATTAWPLLAATFLPVVFLSGVFFPLGDELAWLGTAASWLPALPIEDVLARALAYHGSGLASVSVRDLLVLTGWGVGGFLVALATFRWEPAALRLRERSLSRRPART
jgi:ABC-2 type transport system permease protein